MCREILHNISALKNASKNVKLCWIPSHVGIKGNEEADGLAVAAAMNIEEYIPVYYKDWYPKMRQAIAEKWNEKCREVSQKMFEVKETAGEWMKVKLSRGEEVVLNRLRSGHTYLTQRYLMNGEVQAPTICHFCNDAILTVRYLLLLCPALDDARGHGKVFRESSVVMMRELLNTPETVACILRMLRSLRVFSAI